jgi:predicted SAM-dependent methyltransferase
MSLTDLADVIQIQPQLPSARDDVPEHGIRLHIGGREKRDGWKIFDTIPGPDVDFVGRLTDLSAVPDESCAEVYASHVFEHLGYDHELPVALTHVHRVLKPGGRFCISVPDLLTLCRLFVHPALDSDARWNIMRMMFGGRTSEQDVHQAGLTFDFLHTFLQEAGFRDIRRVREFGLFDDTSSLCFGGVPISLNVEARKGAA